MPELSYYDFCTLCREHNVPRSAQTDLAFSVAAIIDKACGAELLITNDLGGPTLCIAMLNALPELPPAIGNPHLANDTRIFIRLT